MDDEEEKKDEDKSSNQTAFLASFADLMSLLVVFFVLLFSMSEIRKHSFLALIESLAGKFNPERVIVTPKPSAQTIIPKIDREPASNLFYLYEVLQEQLSSNQQVKSKVYINMLEDRVIITLLGQDMFLKKTSELSKIGRETIVLISDFLRQIDNRVDINIHARPNQTEGTLFSNEWEMTLFRGRSIKLILKDFNLERDIPILAFGDSRYKDLSGDIVKKKRLVLANRVDIVLRDHIIDSAFGGQ